MGFWNHSNRRLARFCVVGLAAVLTGVATDASAQQHRARIARSLDAQIAARAAGRLKALVTAPQSEIDRLSKAYGVRVERRLEMGAVLSGTSHQLDAVAGDRNVGALSSDDVVFSTMGVTTQSTGASQLWRGDGSDGSFGGLTGLGVGVAVIDSGVASHPDLVRRLRATKDFTGSGDGDAYGHGTHVAGIIAGSGSGSQTGEGNLYVGMAPGAELLSLRVLGADGTGLVSDVIAALEWAVANQVRYRIRVVNLSLGHAPSGAPEDDPLAMAVERAVASGLVVVCSAGNLGKTQDGTSVIGGIVSPGNTAAALTVGALNTKGTVVRSDDTVATYSSRGPAGNMDDESTWRVKPDLVAPGNAIVATGVQGSYLWNLLPDRRVAGPNGGAYLTLSGSSMATAVVSGAVAQLLQLEPELTPDQVKTTLQFTAQHLDGFAATEQGAGSLNVPLAAAFVRTGGDFAGAPVASIIAGEQIAGWQVTTEGSTDATASLGGHSITWGKSGAVSGDTIVWGGRNGSVTGNTIVWGGRKGAVTGDTIVWGGRKGGVTGDTIVWGGRQGAVTGDTIVWGGRKGGVTGDTIVWGGRKGGVTGDTIVWGGRQGAVTGDTIVWGGRQGGVTGDTIVWGGRKGGVTGDTIVWGGRKGAVASDTIVWGGRQGAVTGDTIVWGGRKGGVTGDTIVWGGRKGVVASDTIVWGGRQGGVTGDTIVWGGRQGGVTGDTIVWGGRKGSVASDTIVWGGRTGSVTGNTIVWGGRQGGVTGDTIVWGGRKGSVASDTIVWGGRTGSVTGNTIVWGGRQGAVTGDTIVWGGRKGAVTGDTIVWGGRKGGVTGDTIVWGGRTGSVNSDTIPTGTFQ